jgi:hypothetical protein
MWNRKAIQSQKLHGKMNQHSPMMATWFNNTKTVINYKSRLVDKEQRNRKRRKTIKTERILKEQHSIKQISLWNQIEMSTTAAAQPVLTVVKDEFTEVLTEESLSSSTKPTDWNVVITEKSLLKAMRTPSPSPEEIWHGIATTPFLPMKITENSLSTISRCGATL